MNSNMSAADLYYTLESTFLIVGHLTIVLLLSILGCLCISRKYGARNELNFAYNCLIKFSDNINTIATELKRINVELRNLNRNPQ